MVFIVWAVVWTLVGFVLGGWFWSWWYCRKVGDNAYRIDMARMYFGRRWAKAIIECDRAHLPGDCVLCGGESVDAPPSSLEGAGHG